MMPIQPLSDATSRVLTSTQALNNAASVVKELVDNAIDARASTILIEITANTLDKIIVKDDGIGIGVQDRQLLCKHGCTSKIADLDDLAMLGGKFLGFRGTALASIAELSKEVTVVTKVDGEQPATTMTFGHSGKLLSSASASHNDGTTVRVENFLAPVPVRRQFVLKNPSKVLDEITKLLQGYALARPNIKFALKVLKAKNNKANWSFAACKGGGQLSAAAAQVVGKAVAGLCKTQSVSLEREDGEDGEPVYKVDAILLDARTIDVSRGGGVGQYIAIDGRPVSHEKGVMKDLIKRYKAYLQHACQPGATIPSKPFVAIHFHCPARSYDVNIEPAKDVVLFHNQSRVLALAGKLFVQCYGELATPDINERQDPTQPQVLTPSSFDILLARKKQHSSNDNPLGKHTDTQKSSTIEDISRNSHSAIETFHEAVIRRPLLSSNTLVDLSASIEADNESSSKTHSNMSNGFNGFNSEIMPPPKRTPNAPDGEEVYDPSDVTINNPFTRAKIHSLRRPDHPPSVPDPLFNANTRRTDISTGIGESPVPVTPSRNSMTTLAHHLPTPKSSPFASDEPYQNPGPPFQRRSKRVRLGEELGTERRIDNTSGTGQPPVQRQSILGVWANPSAVEDYQPFQSASSVHARGVSDPQQQPSPSNSRLDVASPNDSQSPQRFTNKPFRPPLKTVRSPHARHDSNIQRDISSDLTQSSFAVPSGEGEDEDLQNILDFEHRKKAVNQRRKLNQATLNPGDLARIQRSSDLAADLSLSQSRHVEPHDVESNTSVSLDDLARRFNEDSTTTTTPRPARPNPHQNRYLAAIRHLQPQHATKDPVHSHPPADQPDNPSLSPTDPRAILIKHQQFSSHHALENRTSKLNRVKTSRLPFETIPPDAVKHDLLAHPSPPFPSVPDLSIATQRLLQHDAYVTTGEVRATTWDATDGDLQRWKGRLDRLVREIHRSEDGSASQGIELPLAAAVEAHVEYIS